MHSDSVAAHAIVSGLRMKLTLRQIAILAFAALLHDVAHPAFSHDGDRYAEFMGFPPHEARGQKLLETNQDLYESILMARLSVAEVVAVMREEGDLGQILKVMDTLAYVVMDSAIVGDSLPSGFSAWVITSITGVKDGRLQVLEAGPLGSLLAIRARLSRDIYYHLRNLLAAESLLFGFKKLGELGLLQADQIVTGTDGYIEMLLTEIINSGDVPEFIRRAFGLAHGFLQELQHAELKVLETKTDFEAAWSKLTPNEVGRAFGIEPYNYIRKSLKVQDPEGKEIELKASSKYLSAESQKWYLLVWKED
jgi:HD superfamily phosphohydrolase